MDKQLIFIDDSGDPGLPPKWLKSRYFLVVCVVFKDAIDAELVGANLKVLKRDMKWKQEHEFKFNKTNNTHREQFFKAVRKYNFTVRAIVVDKKTYRLPSGLRADSFYQFAIKELLNSYREMKDAKVYLDGKAGKNYRLRSGSYLRKELNKASHRLEELKFVDSKADVLIQLADMMAGAIRRKYEYDDAELFKLIKSKIEDTIEY